MIIMLIRLFGKILILFTACALLGYGLIPSATLGLLAKLLAIAFGGSLLVPIIHTNLRGIKKGDKVNVVDETSRFPKFLFFAISNGVALDNGRANEQIKIELLDGSVGIGTITKYEGFFSNPEVKLLEKSIPIEIKG